MNGRLVRWVGILVSIAAAFFLASAIKRTPGWRHWAWPARWVGIAFIVMLTVDAVLSSLAVGGLLERLLAATGAAAIGALAWRVSSCSGSQRPAPAPT